MQVTNVPEILFKPVYFRAKVTSQKFNYLQVEAILIETLNNEDLVPSIKEISKKLG
jgi:hypothetical protein